MGESNNPGMNRIDEDWIVGTWDWEKTVSLGWSSSAGSPSPITPQSTDCAEQWRFLPDGQVEFYKDGKLIYMYPYRTESYLLGPTVTPATPASTERYCVLYLYIDGAVHNMSRGRSDIGPLISGAGVRSFPSYSDCTITFETLTIREAGEACGPIISSFVRAKKAS